MPGMAPRTGLEGPMDLSLDVGVEEEPCPECGAPAGEPCDPMCPNAEHEDPRDPDRAYDSRVDNVAVDPAMLGIQREGKEETVTEFDKFMDRIVLDEHKQQKVNPKREDNVQRQRAARIQDRPMNKTRWGGR